MSGNSVTASVKPASHLKLGELDQTLIKYVLNKQLASMTNMNFSDPSWRVNLIRILNERLISNPDTSESKGFLNTFHSDGITNAVNKLEIGNDANMASEVVRQYIIDTVIEGLLESQQYLERYWRA